ncbi:FH2 domain-containing protein 1 [Salminus brasiliensis]|uniref:FH2 domain-containing protein 1 n=1 Tax=Salminus brasiliensis TaxID=930266 RepID=UPI003B833D96
MASGMAAMDPASEYPSPDPPRDSYQDPDRLLTHSSGPNPTLGPPPAPPLPPPPPPPPPQTVSQPGQPHASRKKRRVRSFYWKPIPEEKVRGKPNIWTLAVRQQQYQIDVRTVEELFGQQEEVRNPVPSGHPRSGRPRSSFKESKDEISILDSKRGMNVGIFLKQFKKSNDTIVEDIRLGSSKQYGAEPLKELLKLLPEAEEIKKLRDFKGDPAKLTLVDSFMFLLIQVPRFDVRIEAMVVQEEFAPSCAVMSREINIVRLATDELMTCEELHAILHLVLQAGNIMNAGGYAGNAVGFKLSSLLSLADTKANKPGMNLLHFVALEAQKKDENLLKFPEKLTHVQSAVRISVESIEAEFSSLYVRTRSLEEKIQSDADLLVQLDPFLQNSTRTLQDLKRRRLDLRKEGNALIDFFCEDKETFKLDECFRIFQDFCLKFKKAVKDNLERDLKEAARQRRLRELEERRFAWAAASGGQGNNGGFGRSSSENDVDILTKEGLLDFLLQPRPQSPHSPLGRSASARRYRHATADRNLRSYLELFSGSPAAESAKFSSLPRSGRPHQRRTMPWLASQDDNRELGAQNQLYHEKLATSPKAETEPISPLARYSMSGYAVDNDAYNNNTYMSISEGIIPPRLSHPRNVFQKSQGQAVGQMTVNVERHTLVPGLQPFELTNPNNNNSGYMPLDNQGDIFVTDLEERELPKSLVLDTPPSSKSSEEAPRLGVAHDSKITSPQREEEEDTSTVSSTTCDTPLPLDPSLSNKKCIPYILDCTETDCSVMLDCSELESSSIFKDGSRLDVKAQDNIRSLLRDPSSLSSNFESLSTNDPSVSTSTDEPIGGKAVEERPESVTPSVTTDDADTDSCDTAEGRKVGEKAVQTCSSKLAHSKAKAQSKSAVTRIGRPARTLTATETQNLRKVVPITKLSRSISNAKRLEKSLGHEAAEARRPLRDQSTPARRTERQGRPARHSSLPPEQAKPQRGMTPIAVGSRWARDPTPHKPSFKKPNAKPIRNIPKPPPEEKMCRSTMRALAQAQAQAQAQAVSEGSVSQAPTHASKVQPALPSFARNTVASSSRTKKDLPIQPVPGTPSKSSTLSRSSSQKAPSGGKAESVCSGHSAKGEEKPSGSLRRVQSVRAPSRNTQRSDTPPPQTVREPSRKGSSFSEKSFPISGRTLKPMWK